MVNHANYELLDNTCTSTKCEHYYEKFEIWYLTLSNLNEKQTKTSFYIFINENSYSLVSNLAFPENPVKTKAQLCLTSGLQNLLSLRKENWIY